MVTSLSAKKVAEGYRCLRMQSRTKFRSWLGSMPCGKVATMKVKLQAQENGQRGDGLTLKSPPGVAFRASGEKRGVFISSASSNSIETMTGMGLTSIATFVRTPRSQSLRNAQLEPTCRAHKGGEVSK